MRLLSSMTDAIAVALAGQAAMLRAFFDIYENDDENAAIVDQARREGLGAVMADLPDQSTLAESAGQGQ